MINDLLLLSGNDIPFEKAQLVIHQPTLKEIAFIVEESFYTGCEFLRFSKNNLTEEDRIHLEDKSNFEILMILLREKNIVIQKNKMCIFLVLTLLFPNYNIEIKNQYISLISVSDNQEYKIDNNNFEDFKEILNSIFYFNYNKNSNEFNPQGELSKKIADKFKKRHQILSEKDKNIKVSILSRYASILSLGLKIDINTVLNYTVYQIMDQFQRFGLKTQYDFYIQAKLAGAQDLKEVDDWMKDIYT